MVPMTRATCTEEPYDSNRITYGSETAGGGATRLLTVPPKQTSSFGTFGATAHRADLSVQTVRRYLKRIEHAPAP